MEGSKVLEILAEQDLLDDFYDAVDADNFPRIESILEQTGIDPSAIAQVLLEIENSTGVI